jgi:HAMP domain-containing protein
MVELLLTAVVVIALALLVARLWLARRRSPLRHLISEAEARENAAPLSTAIIGSDRRGRTAS